ncbi:hypothetical protein I4U23_004242 [Adineta vaga]|nr:hypothetical protein I4U23_004242 [Adineta vaga]
MKLEDTIHLEMQEPFLTTQIISTKKHTVRLWLRRILTLDTALNENHYLPIFIIVVSILHIIIFLTTYLDVFWKEQPFAYSLRDLWMFFLPCMRPTSNNDRMVNITCGSSIHNWTCYYDEALRNKCFSFLYPHQLWRLITVNFVHLSWLHLLFNISRQLLLGILLERKYGSMRIFLIYWISNVGASLCFMLINTQRPGIGASGAVYGLLLFFIVERLSTMRMNPDQRIYILIQLILLIVIPMTISLSTVAILRVNTAHSAHFGGGLVGFLFGIGMFGCPCPWNNEYGCYQTICRRTAYVLLVLYFIFTLSIFLLINAPYVDWIFYRIH